MSCGVLGRMMVKVEIKALPLVMHQYAGYMNYAAIDMTKGDTYVSALFAYKSAAIAHTNKQLSRHGVVVKIVTGETVYVKNT